MESFQECERQIFNKAAMQKANFGSSYLGNNFHISVPIAELISFKLKPNPLRSNDMLLVLSQQ